MRFKELATVAEALLRDPSPVISLEAAHALLRVDAERCLDQVIAAAGERPDWPVSRILAALEECGGDRVGPALSAALRSALAAGGARLPRLLRFLPVAPGETTRPAVLDVLAKSPAPEVLAAGLEALWHPEDVPLARRGASHDAWFVRLAAAKALRRIGTARDEALLLRLLGDPSWWVRYRAAQALAALPGVDRATLEQLRSAGAGRFAGDILAQVMAEAPERGA